MKTVNYLPGPMLIREETLARQDISRSDYGDIWPLPLSQMVEVWKVLHGINKPVVWDNWYESWEYKAYLNLMILNQQTWFGRERQDVWKIILDKTVGTKMETGHPWSMEWFWNKLYSIKTWYFIVKVRNIRTLIHVYRNKQGPGN